MEAFKAVCQTDQTGPTRFSTPLRGTIATRRFIELVTGNQNTQVRWQISSPQNYLAYYYKHIATYVEFARRLEKEQAAFRNVDMYVTRQWNGGESSPTGVVYINSGGILDFTTDEFPIFPDFIVQYGATDSWTAYWLISDGDQDEQQELRYEINRHFKFDPPKLDEPLPVPGFLHYDEDHYSTEVILHDFTGHSLSDCSHWDGLHTISEFRTVLHKHDCEFRDTGRSLLIVSDDQLQRDAGGTFAGFREWEANSRPKTPYLINGFLPDDALYMLYGASQSLKTFAMLDVACSAASGRVLWQANSGNPKGLTNFTIPEKLRVVFLAGEAANNIPIRIAAWKKFHNITKKLDVFIIPEAPRFDTPKNVDKLIKTIAEKFGYTDILIIDTVMETATGWNMNEPAHAKLYIEVCKRLRKHLLATICLIHHTGKDLKEFLGAYQLFADVDVVDKIRPHGSRHERKVVCISQQKERDNALRGDIWLETNEVEFEVAGKLTDSLALVPLPGSGAGQASNTSNDLTSLAIQFLQEQGVGKRFTMKAMATELARQRGGRDLTDDAKRKQIDCVRKALAQSIRGSLRDYVKQSGQGPRAPWIFELPS
jgi:hypothetical protein